MAADVLGATAAYYVMRWVMFTDTAPVYVYVNTVVKVNNYVRGARGRYHL
jgi:hypothetical protein